MDKNSDSHLPAASSLDEIVEDIRGRCPADGRITFLSGDFNIVHPGHTRLFNFAAECGDFLVVGVNADGLGNTYLKQELRFESIRSISTIDYAFLLKHPSETLIARLRPDVVVKGREYSDKTNPEQAAVDAYGGKLMFSSGDVRFSSLDRVHEEISSSRYSNIEIPWNFPERHDFALSDLEKLIERIPSLNVVVVGDLIVDRYITCEALGMSREDPTIVVAPLTEDTFIGGAGIIAAHARQLGAATTLFSVTGKDSMAQFARETLEDYGVELRLHQDDTRPTTMKRRFRAEGKTLLRVNEFRQHDIGKEVCDDMLGEMEAELDKADLLIFSDFSYGCLPQVLVDAIIGRCMDKGIRMFADSQVSSQIGNVSRFKGMDLITPTELEARTACRDFSSGLVGLARILQDRAETPNVIITLGSDGLLIQTTPTPQDPIATDRLPALNPAPAGTSGAGDSLLACAALCMALGATIWEASFLGAVGAACQVSRVGNLPLVPESLLKELRA